MTSDCSDRVEPCRLDTNRHSTRISNKHATKLDVSTVRTKMDFMRSLNLVCTKNTKEFISRMNWEVFAPKDGLPLKECSVVIKAVICEVCKLSFNNKSDMELHKRLHCHLSEKENARQNDIINKVNLLNNSETKMQNSCIPYKSFNSVVDLNSEKSVNKKRTKATVTKVTLRIGGEVISKVCFKKKYLKNICSKMQKISRGFHPENCKNCSNIQDMLQNPDINSNFPTEAPSEECNTHLSNHSMTRIRKMAATLVKLEIERKSRENTKNLNGIYENEYHITRENDDAVVPTILHTSVDSAVEELSRITENDHFLSDSSADEFSCPENKCEVITIDDGICDNFDDDCIIINELLPNQNLKTAENSYIFQVSPSNNLKINVEKVHAPEILTEKRTSDNANLSDSPRKTKTMKICY